MPTVGVFAAIFDDQGRILLVRRNYGPQNWTTPGGRLDPFESPFEALRREVAEETGLQVVPGELIGVYAAPFKDDVVLFFRAHLVAGDRKPDPQEIAEMRFFAEDELPDLGARTLRRVSDAFDGVAGVARVFNTDDVD